jgi:hypothetical protein
MNLIAQLVPSQLSPVAMATVRYDEIYVTVRTTVVTIVTNQTVPVHFFNLVALFTTAAYPLVTFATVTMIVATMLMNPTVHHVRLMCSPATMANAFKRVVYAIIITTVATTATK